MTSPHRGPKKQQTQPDVLDPVGIASGIGLVLSPLVLCRNVPAAILAVAANLSGRQDQDRPVSHRCPAQSPRRSLVSETRRGGMQNAAARRALSLSGVAATETAPSGPSRRSCLDVENCQGRTAARIPNLPGPALPAAATAGDYVKV
jgi:hypothetical protein